MEPPLMPLVAQPIPQLHGGVSQQAAVVRAPGQCEGAVNCNFTLATGVGKRPPLECIAEIAGVDWSSAFCDVVSHVSGSQHLVVIPGDGQIHVHRLADGARFNGEGTEQGVDYLRCTGRPSEVFSVFTVGDKVYVLNREVTVRMSDSKAPGVIGGTAQSLADDVLDKAANGFIYRILGDADFMTGGYYAKKTDDKWVEWIKPGSLDTLDAATMPHTLLLKSDSVAPLGIRWEFVPATWDLMTVGDDKSNKQPSFVGREIAGMFFVSDRLGFLSGNGFTLSEVGEEHHRNFWRTTVLDVLDGDRIDSTVASDGVANLRWAMPMGKSVILSSDERQFSLDWQGALTPSTVNVTEAMAYPASGMVNPVSAGPNVYWITGDSDYGSLMEMFVQDHTLSTDATDVTGHTPRYLPLPITRLSAHTNANAVFAVSGNVDARDRLYVYKYHWQGDQKVQSAWSYWKFDGCELLTTAVVGDHLYVVYRAAVGSTWATYVGRINLRANAAGIAGPLGFPHPVNLDQLVAVPAEAAPAESRTYFTSPFPLTDLSKVQLVRTKDHGPEKGRILVDGSPFKFVRVSDHSFYIPTIIGGRWLMGLKYTQEYTFSEQFYQANGQVMLNARVQLRNMKVSFDQTGAFKTRVKVRGSAANIGTVLPDVELVSAYSSRTLGDEYFTLGTVRLQTGTYRFPVYASTGDAEISLLNDTYLPANFMTAEWEALVTTRTR
jgi:hypothetical protein